GAAHDFNNLLSAMLGHVILAERKLSADHAARRHLNEAGKAAERAAHLTRQMLAYSGHGAFLIRPMDLNALVRDNLSLFEAAIPKRVRLMARFAEDLPHMEADLG